MPRAESALPLMGGCASGHWQCPGRMDRPSPGPGESPRGTHSLTWTPPTKASGFSAGLASWAFLIPWGHEAQVSFPAAHLPPIVLSCAVHCARKKSDTFPFTSCRALFSTCRTSGCTCHASESTHPDVGSFEPTVCGSATAVHHRVAPLLSLSLPETWRKFVAICPNFFSATLI